MAKLNRKKGITSQILHIFIQDSSATTGAGLIGLVYNSAGLVCKHINAGGILSGAITLEDITTLGTYQTPTANTNMRFKEINSVSPSQGVYEIHVHNDWMNFTGGSLIIMLAGATNMAQFRLEIDLQADVNITHVAGTAQTAGDIPAMITAVDDYVDTEVGAIKAKTDNLPTDPASNTQVNTRLATSGYTAPDNASIAAILDDTGTNGVVVTAASKTGYSISGTKTTLDALNDITAASVWVVTTRTLTSFGTLIDDIWNYSTRTITAFSTSLALSVWDILETAILTASSIGLKVKNNLDATISSRLATSGYTAPDNAGISSILTESQSHPTLGEIEASAVIAKETTITAVKTKTDTIVWGDITDIKDVSIGKWSINKSTNVLTIYKVDGVTVLKTFNLTDNSSVSERVPI